jgi:hypothetical protein
LQEACRKLFAAGWRHLRSFRPRSKAGITIETASYNDAKRHRRPLLVVKNAKMPNETARRVLTKALARRFEWGYKRRSIASPARCRAAEVDVFRGYARRPTD